MLAALISGIEFDAAMISSVCSAVNPVVPQNNALPCALQEERTSIENAHIHLIPMQNEKDMLFSNPKLKLTDEEFKAVAEAIRAVL